MPYHAQREPDLEGNQGGHASREIYNVNDPSWTIDHSRHNIITKISKPVGSWFNVQENSDSDEHSYRIDFAELQRIRLRQIQHKLVQHAISIRYDAREPPGWAEDLRQYGKSNISPKQLHSPCILLMRFHDSRSPTRLRLYIKTQVRGYRPIHRNWRAIYRSPRAPGCYEG